MNKSVFSRQDVAKVSVLIFVSLVFDQVPVIKKTWEKDALFLEYYSDHADPSIPTIDIGVPNTERGEFLVVQPFIFRVSCFYMEVHEKWNGKVKVQCRAVKGMFVDVVVIET